jgi:hypothetical protein
MVLFSVELENKHKFVMLRKSNAKPNQIWYLGLLIDKFFKGQKLKYNWINYKG